MTKAKNRMRDGLIKRGRYWYAKIYIGRDPITGKKRDKWFCLETGNFHEAKKRRAELIAQMRSGDYVEPTKLTLGDYLSGWLADKKSQVVGSTYDGYRTIVERHLVPALGNIAIGKLAPVHIQDYYRNALETGHMGKPGNARRGGALSARTVKSHHRVLNQSLKDAVKRQIISRNPCDAVDPPRPVQKEMAILSLEQSMKMLSELEGDRLHTPVMLAMTTGMRRGEILGLRWSDVDLEAGTISVSQALAEASDGIDFKMPKTNRGRRTIALLPMTVDALRAHQVRQKEERLRAGPVFQDNDLVCCREDGSPWPPGNLTQRFSRAARRLGYKVRLHGLRHTHISHMLAQNINPKIVSERAGHAGVAITLDVYSHVIPGLQQDAANAMDAALRTAKEHAETDG